jgi:hypothetical protein
LNDGYVLHNESGVNENGVGTYIETAAFKMDIVYVSKVGWFNEYVSNDTTDDSESTSFLLMRRLRKKSQCNQEDQQDCCVADGISKSSTVYKNKKEQCMKIGCKVKVCGGNKRRNRVMTRAIYPSTNNLRSLQSVPHQNILVGDLYGTDFNEVLEEHTDLDPISTGAIVDATSLEDVAECRASNYNATEYDTPTLECGEYNESSCADNDYVVVESNTTEANGTGYCLPDDFYCNDDNKCTVDSWDSVTMHCRNVPLNCSANQSCDPVDG